MLEIKTIEQLSAETSQLLLAAGIEDSPGGIARLFLNIINEQLSDLYTALEVNHANAFVSTAQGTALDSLGVMMGCVRERHEEDDAYRFRLVNQHLSFAKANETAIRLAALSVTHVEDVLLKPHTLGIGSFTALVLTDGAETNSVLNDVETSIGNVAAYGVRVNVVLPKETPIEISIKLLLKDYVSEAKAQEIRLAAREVVMTHFLNKTIGESFYADQLRKDILNLDGAIISVVCERFTVNETLTSFANQTCEWDERFGISNNPEAVVVH